MFTRELSICLYKIFSGCCSMKLRFVDIFGFGCKSPFCAVQLLVLMQFQNIQLRKLLSTTNSDQTKNSVCSFHINLLYSYIDLTILDFLHSVEIAFFLFFFSSCVCICASVFLLTCILFLFNADVNWLPGSASPYDYSRQVIL